LEVKEYKIMEWKQFQDKYKDVKEGFNNSEFDERFKMSINGRYDAIAELIKTKDIIRESMNKLNSRINKLSKSLDEDLKSLKSTPNN